MVRHLLIGSLLFMLPATAAAETLVATYQLDVGWPRGYFLVPESEGFDPTDWIVDLTVPRTPPRAIYIDSGELYVPGATVPILPVGMTSRVEGVDYSLFWNNDSFEFFYNDLGPLDADFDSMYSGPITPANHDDFRRVNAVELTVTKLDASCDRDGDFCFVWGHAAFEARFYAPTLVPEPTSWLLLLIGGCFAGHRVRL